MARWWHCWAFVSAHLVRTQATHLLMAGDKRSSDLETEKLNSWLSLGANVGVVIGLVLLIVEINQNTAMMQSQIHQSRTDTSLSEQQANYNSIYR